MLNKNRIPDALFSIDLWLQREVPVLFEGSIPDKLTSARFFIPVGLLANIVAIAFAPNGWHLPWNWAIMLFNMPDLAEIILYVILTLLMVTALCYSVGLFLVFWVRLAFRYLLHRSRVPGQGIL